jgi:hypothetical protein
MEPDRLDIDEFMRVCDSLLQYLNDEEAEEIVCVIYLVSKKTVRPYDELDDLAASLAFSKLPSTD